MYGHQKTLVSLENRIRNASYPEDDKELLLRYEDFLFARGLSISRVIKYMNALNLIAAKWGVSFKDATKNDVVSLVGRIER